MRKSIFDTVLQKVWELVLSWNRVDCVFDSSMKLVSHWEVETRKGFYLLHMGKTKELMLETIICLYLFIVVASVICSDPMSSQYCRNAVGHWTYIV